MPLLSVGQIKHQQEELSSEFSDANADLNTKVQQGPGEPISTSLMRDEFLNYSYKYMGHLDRTLQQLQSELNKPHPLHICIIYGHFLWASSSP